MGALDTIATALVLAGVWLISALDVRGQYLMILAQIAWGTWAAIGENWALLAQSAVLLLMSMRAVSVWRKTLGGAA